MIGRINVRGIRFHAFHGLTKLERKIGVRHRVDVALVTDISRAAESDDIEHTVDYRGVHDVVVRVGRSNSFHLIETLATRIAQELLETFPVDAVEVDVMKETPVVDGILDTVGVSLSITREEFDS